MTMNLAETTKADVYAVAQDLAERLESQKALNEALRAELTELAARPCLACAVAPTHAALIGEARRLLDGAIRHRNAAMTTDSVARMISNEQWPHFLEAVEQWERKLAVAAQGGV